MDNITQGISLFPIVVDLCSVLGLIVGIYTLIKARSIKSSVEDVKRKIMFSNSAMDIVENIQQLREVYYNAIYNKDVRAIKELLYKLKTATEILIRYVPSDHKKKCNLLVRQLNKQYHSKIILNKKASFFYNSDVDDLWDTYFKVSDLIDVTIIIIKENKILS